MSFEDFYKKSQEGSHKTNKRKILRSFIALISLGALCFSLLTIFKWQKDNYQIRQMNKKIAKNITVNSKDNETFSVSKDNFSNLLAQNKDTVAYIHMNNTNVNYSVVQTTDNKFYLNHAFDGSKNDAGWVFMDYRNNIDDLDDNTIIYGHARLDGTMFGSLKNVLTSYWQDNKDNYIIYLSTLKENMIFQIFSIYTTKNESYYIMPNFHNNTEKKKWIKTMKQRNIAPFDAEVDVNDKFLTLSTCQNNHGGRIVIQAKLIESQDR